MELENAEPPWGPRRLTSTKKNYQFLGFQPFVVFGGWKSHHGKVKMMSEILGGFLTSGLAKAMDFFVGC